MEIAHLFEDASHISVVFFFVLSGFVLSLSLALGQKTIAFYVRRVWRVYPALWAASILALLYVLYAHKTLPSQSDWFRQYFQIDMFDIKHVIASFLALDLFLITPAWTIFVELIGSVLMPAFARLVRFRASCLALAIISVCIAFLYPGKFYAGTYMPCFILGSAIAIWRSRGALDYLHHHPALLKTLTATALIGALAFRWAFDWSFHDVIPTLVEAVAAGLCVHLLASAHRPRCLEVPFLTRLGDVSYSLYILHFPVMCFAGILIAKQGWSRELSAAVLVVITCALTYALANLSYGYVERGGIRIGRIAARLLTVSR